MTGNPGTSSTMVMMVGGRGASEFEGEEGGLKWRRAHTRHPLASLNFSLTSLYLDVGATTVSLMHTTPSNTNFSWRSGGRKKERKEGACASLPNFSSFILTLEHKLFSFYLGSSTAVILFFASSIVILRYVLTIDHYIFSVSAIVVIISSTFVSKWDCRIP